MSVLVSVEQKDFQQSSENHINKNKILFVMDATLAQGMTSLNTGAFLSAFALYLGASYVVVGLLAALVPLAQMLQVPTTLLVEWYPKRKSIAVSALTIGRTAVLVCGFIPLFFIKSKILPIFFILYVIYVSLSNIGGCAFSTWFRDSFNPDTFSQVLTKRFIYATLLGAVVSFIGAYSLELIKLHHILLLSYGYSAIFIFAGLFGLGSSWALFNIHDSENKLLGEKTFSKNRTVSFIELFKEPFQNTVFRKVMLFNIIWNAVFNFANSFLPVFLMRRLGYSLLIVICLTVINQFANVISFSSWKKFSNKYGNRSLLYLCIPLFFVSILSWFFAVEIGNAKVQWYFIVCLHIISGIGVAGINLCLTNLIFLSTPKGKATASLALNSSLNGLVAGTAPILAGFVAELGTIFKVPSATLFENLHLPITKILAPTLQITGLDLVMIIAGTVGILSATAIHFLIPSHLSNTDTISSPQ
ncbi:MAG TPA: MFS transporter [Candidatus Hydrogenedens sp.]|nr:MFS transporter [Candidatus Hydrogenedens sp.]